MEIFSLLRLFACILFVNILVPSTKGQVQKRIIYTMSEGELPDGKLFTVTKGVISRFNNLYQCNNSIMEWSYPQPGESLKSSFAFEYESDEYNIIAISAFDREALDCGNNSNRTSKYKCCPKADLVCVLRLGVDLVCNSSRAFVGEIELRLTDINDNKPRFLTSSFFLHVEMSMQDTGESAYVEVRAEDEDAGENGEVWYALTNCSENQGFSIDALTGHVSFHPQTYAELYGKLDFDTCVVAAYDKSPTNTGLVMMLTFEQVYGNTVPDMSGNNNVGTLMNGALANYGVVGLDGVDQYIQLPPNIFNGLTAVSITIWVVLKECSLWSRLWEFGSGTPSYFMLSACPRYSNQLTAHAQVNNSGQVQMNTNVSMSIDLLSFVALTQDASGNRKLYLNGDLIGSDVNSVTISSMSGLTQNWIGRSQYPLDSYLKAEIADFRIYNRAISSADIATLFAIGPKNDTETTQVQTLILPNTNALENDTVSETDTNAKESWIEFRPDPSEIGVWSVTENCGTDKLVGMVLLRGISKSEHSVSCSIYDRGGKKQNVVSQFFKLSELTEQNSTYEYALKTAYNLDHEVQSNYLVDVICTSGSSVWNRSLSIEVEDVDDNRPTFSQRYYYFSIQENTLLGVNKSVNLGSVFAYDVDVGDNSLVEFSLEPLSDIINTFRIDKNTGEIYARVVLDRESRSRYIFNVTARNPKTEARSTYVQVHVEVTDEDDNLAVFTESSYRFSVSENVGASETQRVIIGRIIATDPDIGQNAVIEYFLVNTSLSNSDRGLFQIDKDTGLISLVSPLDRERKDSYKFQVGAKNPNGISARSRPTFVQVSVHVLDENDNTPRIKFPIPKTNYNIQIENSMPVGSIILRVLAVDSDIGQNSQLKYEIVNVSLGLPVVTGKSSSNSASSTLRAGRSCMRKSQFGGKRPNDCSTFFAINKISGEISLAASLLSLKKLPASYIVKVKVSDGGRPKLSDDVEFVFEVVRSQSNWTSDRDVALFGNYSIVESFYNNETLNMFKYEYENLFGNGSSISNVTSDTNTNITTTTTTTSTTTTSNEAEELTTKGPEIEDCSQFMFRDQVLKCYLNNMSASISIMLQMLSF